MQPWQNKNILKQKIQVQEWKVKIAEWTIISPL